MGESSHASSPVRSTRAKPTDRIPSQPKYAIIVCSEDVSRLQTSI